ncbi:CBS domain-containing protein [Pseudonocardia asaccharolytica]|nr:CBS domain-containing protein [Pseudonocardia asaccharolytica]
MTRTVFSVLPDTDLHEVAQVLFANAVRAVPVVDGVEGVVAVVDELSYLVDEMVAESRIGPLY